MAEETYGDWIRSNPPRPTKKYKKEHMAQQSAVTLFEVFFYKNAKSVGINNNKWQIDETTLDIMLEKAKAIEKAQHGQTWDAAIKAHDDRGVVHARSLVDFDEYYNDTFKK